MTDFFKTKRFIALMACLNGITALGIDAVLPIFPQLIDYYALPHDQHNRIQLVVFVYILGFSFFQLLFGILADTFGRKALLLVGISVYTIAVFCVLLTSHFEMLLLARFIQGAGLAAPRVLSITIIRDVSSGRDMSRIMSFVTMVFLAIPALAPTVGQLIVMIAPWQGVFILLGVLGMLLLVWIWLDLPETIKTNNRRPLSLVKITSAVQEFLGRTTTLVYLLMITLLFASLMIYIGQAEQILQKDVYKLGELFPLAFAVIVLGMIAASVTNARLVMRIGMRRMILLSLTVLLINDVIFMLITLLMGGIMPLWLFLLLLTIHFFCFGLSTPNLNALALEHYQHIAGTASALIGTLTNIVGVFLAALISAFFAANLYAMAVGFMLCSMLLWLLNRYLRHHR